MSHNNSSYCHPEKLASDSDRQRNIPAASRVSVRVCAALEGEKC